MQFTLPQAPASAATATLTVALSSIINGKRDSDLTVCVNGYGKNQQFGWTVPAADAGQSAIRSGILSFYLYHEYAFPAALLHAGTNHLYFHIPGSPGENLQYDALRLEIK